MLNTNQFINSLVDNGYSHLCVVPCSFAKNIINASLNSKDKLEYLPCASEAVACSVAAGLKLSGKKPIVIVQSSGLTNMGSCITSLLVPYDITFPIIVSWRTYSRGDSEIQHQHLATKLPSLIVSYGYKSVKLNKNDLCEAISQINLSNDEKIICLLEKETFSEIKLSSENQQDLSQYPRRSAYLEILNKNFNDTDEIIIGTTGNTAREMNQYMTKTNNFYMAGNMGGALSLGFGAAKAGKKVTVCGGDAEFVMHLGGITTVGRYKNISLSYIIFDNKSNKSTGGQNSFQEHLDYLNIAKSSGINATFEVDSVYDFNNYIKEIKNLNEVSVARVLCSYDPMSPRPDRKTIQISKEIFQSR